jgi:ribulose-phosphate 3-epimerase
VALDKLRWLRERVDKQTLLSVDGGVNHETIASCAAAGATLFVTGTALLGADDYRERLGELRRLAETGRNARD